MRAPAGGTPELGWSSYRAVAGLIFLIVAVQVVQLAIGRAATAILAAGLAAVLIAVGIRGRDSIDRPPGRTGLWIVMGLFFCGAVLFEVFGTT